MTLLLYQTTEAEIVENISSLSSTDNFDTKRAIAIFRWFLTAIKKNQIYFVVGNVDHKESILELQINLNGNIENRLTIIQGNILHVCLIL